MILLISRLVARLITVTLVVYWVLLILGTHLPATAVGAVPLPDKWLHFTAYTGLAFLLATTVTAYRRPRWQTYAWMAAVLLIYGALDEVSQIPVPGRHADFADWLANARGIATGLVLHRIALAVYEWVIARSERPN
jgi:VanZ family protein